MLHPRRYAPPGAAAEQARQPGLAAWVGGGVRRDPTRLLACERALVRRGGQTPLLRGVSLAEELAESVGCRAGLSDTGGHLRIAVRGPARRSHLPGVVAAAN